MLESVQRWMAKKKKTRKKNREILCGSPNCLRPREQGKKIFTMLKLGLHKMIFILTLRNEIQKILLNHTLVPLRFAPAFCPFFSICLFAQIWATYYNKPHWYCEILMAYFSQFYQIGASQLRVMVLSTKPTFTSLIIMP